MSEIVVNGEVRQLPREGETVAQLLTALGAEGAQVAVMVNARIVGRAAHDATRLVAGDRVEVLTLARGG
jgi:thiamine biosynthesis protein ThiS